MEGVDAFLLLDAVPSALITARVKVLLNRLADGHVFDLHLVAEIRRIAGCPGIQVLLRHVELKNGQRAFGFERQNNVQETLSG